LPRPGPLGTGLARFRAPGSGRVKELRDAFRQAPDAGAASPTLANDYDGCASAGYGGGDGQGAPILERDVRPASSARDQSSVRDELEAEEWLSCLK
jgi:hypothetical protein